MPSDCLRCDGSRISVSVPNELAAYTEASGLDCCRRCLSIEGTDVEEATDGSLRAIHDRFPTGDGGVGLLLLVDRLESLALNRHEIESLVDYLESNGVDVFLTLDRLLAGPGIEPTYDLARRRDQLEALLEN